MGEDQRVGTFDRDSIRAAIRSDDDAIIRIIDVVQAMAGFRVPQDDIEELVALFIMQAEMLMNLHDVAVPENPIYVFDPRWP